MKKQNVNSKLAFNKSIVTELNDNDLQSVNGGSSPYCLSAVVFTAGVIKGIFEELNN